LDETLSTELAPEGVTGEFGVSDTGRTSWYRTQGTQHIRRTAIARDIEIYSANMDTATFPRRTEGFV
jgi:hypothetical protein